MAKKAKRKSPAPKGRRRTPSSKKVAKRKKSTAGPLPVFDDGGLEFKVSGGKSHGKTFGIDLVGAQVAADELTLKHRLKDRGDKPSREFLADLAKEFTLLINADLECSPSLAYWIWLAVDERMGDLQKKTK